MIVSNSNKTQKVEMVANFLNISYIKFATKPLKRGFKKAIKELDLPEKNIAAVGDQIFTDVIGANRMKMYSILVEPLAEKDIWMTKFKRPIENLIIKKYLFKARQIYIQWQWEGGSEGGRERNSEGETHTHREL